MDKREKAGKKSLDSFFNSVMKIVDIRIQHFKEQAKEFVFVPADKAANNIIIVWRKFYIQIDVLKKKSPIHQHSNWLHFQKTKSVTNINF